MPNPIDRIPKFHPAVGALLLAAFLFGFLIFFDLVVLEESFEDVWEGALTSAIVISAFHGLFTYRMRKKRDDEA